MFASRPEKRIATEHTAVEPRYLGTDARGTVHYWDHIQRHVVLVDGGDVEIVERVPTNGKVRLLGDCNHPLRHWREYTDAERGWDSCEIETGSLLFGGVVDAVQG